LVVLATPRRILSLLLQSVCFSGRY
jgi:hypothetical protein